MTGCALEPTQTADQIMAFKKLSDAMSGKKQNENVAGKIPKTAPKTPAQIQQETQAQEIARKRYEQAVADAKTKGLPPPPKPKK